MRYKMLGITLVSLFAATAFAQSMKPGYWEVVTQSPLLSVMQQKMASMSPAERKQVEDTMEDGMAQYGGVSLGEDGMVTKLCVTPEMAELGVVPIQQQGCTVIASELVGNAGKFSYVCTQPNNVSGEGEITYQGDTAFSMGMTAMLGGQILDSYTSSGRWLSADCGNVKPMPQPTGK